MERYLTHPYASPLFGDFTGLPPLLVQAGESEVLRDEVTLLAHKATLAGVQIMHELYEDAVSFHALNLFISSPTTILHQIHVFQAFPFLEASQHAFSSCRAFVRHGFATAQPQEPRPLDVHTEAELANEIDNERAHMVRGDGQDKGPSSVSKGQGDSEHDSTEMTDEDSESSYVSAEDSLAIHIEMDHSWPTSASTSLDVRASDDETEEEEPSSRRASPLKSRRVKSCHGFEHSHHVPSLKRTQHSPSLRSHPGTLNSRLLRISTLSSAPIPSPSIRSSASHPDISSLCQQWESTGPANVTLTYKPSGTTLSASASPTKPKGRKRSPTFHHT